MIKHWIDVYASNSSLAEFKQLLDGICEKLDKNNADHCKHVVDDYYIPAFNFLRHEIDPHLLCSLVGLCKSQPSLPAAPVQVFSQKIISLDNNLFFAADSPCPCYQADSIFVSM